MTNQEKARRMLATTNDVTKVAVISAFYSDRESELEFARRVKSSFRLAQILTNTSSWHEAKAQLAPLSLQQIANESLMMLEISDEFATAVRLDIADHFARKHEEEQRGRE